MSPPVSQVEEVAARTQGLARIALRDWSWPLHGRWITRSMRSWFNRWSLIEQHSPTEWRLSASGLAVRAAMNDERATLPAQEGAK